MDLDDLLPEVGEFGRYQKLLLWLICLPACFPCGFCAFNQLFMTETPNHWCKIPQISNLTKEELHNVFIPKINNTYLKCERYAVNWSDPYEIDSINSSWPTEACLDGWEFEGELFSSIVTDVGILFIFL